MIRTKAWLCALTVERLEEKTERILYWLRETAGDWERTFFITLARAFGFGKNSEAFQLWAATLDPQHMAKHRGQRFSNRSALFRPSGTPRRRSNACTSARRTFPTTRKRISLFKTEICNLADFIERMAISKASSAEFSARAAGSNGCALRIGAFIVRFSERMRGTQRIT